MDLRSTLLFYWQGQSMSPAFTSELQTEATFFPKANVDLEANETKDSQSKPSLDLPAIKNFLRWISEFRLTVAGPTGKSLSHPAHPLQSVGRGHLVYFFVLVLMEKNLATLSASQCEHIRKQFEWYIALPN
jgi:hypothetical protein